MSESDTPRTDVGVFTVKDTRMEIMRDDRQLVDAFLCRTIERELTAVTEQRDRLAELVKKIRAGYGGQLVYPDCDCSDCEFLRPIDEALQSLTTNEL